jgi:hypothetical protein
VNAVRPGIDETDVSAYRSGGPRSTAADGPQVPMQRAPPRVSRGDCPGCCPASGDFPPALLVSRGGVADGLQTLVTLAIVNPLASRRCLHPLHRVLRKAQRQHHHHGVVQRVCGDCHQHLAGAANSELWRLASFQVGGGMLVSQLPEHAQCPAGGIESTPHDGDGLDETLWVPTLPWCLDHSPAPTGQPPASTVVIYADRNFSATARAGRLQREIIRPATTLTLSLAEPCRVLGKTSINDDAVDGPDTRRAGR